MALVVLVNDTGSLSLLILMDPLTSFNTTESFLTIFWGWDILFNMKLLCEVIWRFELDSNQYANDTQLYFSFPADPRETVEP